MAGRKGPIRDVIDAVNHENKFWEEQAVAKWTEFVTVNEAIEPDFPPDQVRPDPYSLSAAFEWNDVDINNDDEARELCTLLTENYVEDDDSNSFRFAYTPSFLKWALLLPGWQAQWHCGVRAKQSGKLVAFIAAVPQTIRVYGVEKKMVEINFLCVHKKLRSKRVAPVLIREIKRRANQSSIFQAAYTAEVIVPKPIAYCRYYHWSLNPKKLIDCRFTRLEPTQTLARITKLARLPDTTKTEGFRQLHKKDVAAASSLLNDHLKEYNIAPVFSKKMIKHAFMPREDVVYTFVVETGGRITDMISFYSLPFSVIGNPNHSTIRAAYGYYCVAGSVPLKQLMSDALIVANQASQLTDFPKGFDVFLALDVMQNETVLEELKFKKSDYHTYYYLYNWRCRETKPSEIGLLLPRGEQTRLVDRTWINAHPRGMEGAGMRFSDKRAEVRAEELRLFGANPKTG